MFILVFLMHVHNVPQKTCSSIPQLAEGSFQSAYAVRMYPELMRSNEFNPSTEIGDIASSAGLLLICSELPNLEEFLQAYYQMENLDVVLFQTGFAKRLVAFNDFSEEN